MVESTKLKENLRKSIVSFSYEKNDGCWRNAFGTLNPDIISEVGGVLPKGTGEKRAGIISYWDMKSEGWRCCYEDMVIQINYTMSLDEYMKNTTE